MLRRRTLLIYFCGLLLANWSTNVLADDQLCPEIEDAKYSELDGLSCISDYDRSVYTFVQAHWTYHTSNSDEYYQLPGSSSGYDGESAYTYLTQSKFYAGKYKCHFKFTKNSDRSICRVVSGDLKPNNKTGASLGESCAVQYDCLALNSECLNDKCQCGAEYKVPYTSAANTCVCLTVAPSETDNCESNSECTQKNYECVNNTCTCQGTESKENGTTMCLKPAKPGGYCDFDDECTLFDSHTECDDNECACIGDYTNGVDNDGHCKAPLSDADIAAIAVAGVFALGVIAIVIRCIAEKMCCKEKKVKKDVEEIEDKFN